MQPYKDILWSLVALLCGVMITAFPTAPFYLGDGTLPTGWLYQISLGAGMLLVGIFTQDISRLGAKLLPPKLYSACGVPLLLGGFLVLANFDRYAEVFSKFGIWPMYVIGAWIASAGMISLVHYLTVFEPADSAPRTLVDDLPR